MMVHFSVSVLLNTLNLKKVNSFVPYYIHTIKCVQHMSGMPNMESVMDIGISILIYTTYAYLYCLQLLLVALIVHL